MLCGSMCSTVEVHVDAACVLVAVPGPVSSPAVNELGSHHVKLTWNEPQQINGIPRGYVISCREGQCPVSTKSTVTDDDNGATAGIYLYWHHYHHQ